MLRYVGLNGADLRGAHFEEADFFQVNFEGAKMSAVNFKNANLMGAINLTAEQLSQVKTLYGARLDL